MNKTEKQLVDLLNKAIHGEKVRREDVEDTDWDKLLYEAKEHHVGSLTK